MPSISNSVAVVIFGLHIAAIIVLLFAILRGRVRRKRAFSGVPSLSGSSHQIQQEDEHPSWPPTA